MMHAGRFYSIKFFQFGNLIFYSVSGAMVPIGPPAFATFAPRPRLEYGTHSGERRPRDGSARLPIAYPP